MTTHCEWCPFPGCDSCAYKGGETVTAQRDSGAQMCENGAGNDERPPTGIRGRSEPLRIATTNEEGLCSW